MIDYNLKAQILDCGLAKIMSKYKYLTYRFSECLSDPNKNYLGLTNEASLIELDRRIFPLEQEALNKWGITLSNNLDPLVRQALLVCQASYLRVRRLREKISKMIEKPCLFLTFTFKPGVYESTSFETKRKYLTRFLKQFGVPYIANVDYGKKNERLHFHCIIQIDYIDYSLWDEYGNLDGERVRKKDGSDVAISKYISKLTNHAIKETCRSNRLIYSRNV